MKDLLTYKDFTGSVHFSAADKVFHGKLEGIEDLVTFEGQSVAELTTAFHEAVEDYIELCKKVGKEPVKTCKGKFNVRVSFDLHRKAAEKATRLGISLNQLVQRALDDKVAA